MLFIKKGYAPVRQLSHTEENKKSKRAVHIVKLYPLPNDANSTLQRYSKKSYPETNTQSLQAAG